MTWGKILRDEQKENCDVKFYKYSPFLSLFSPLQPSQTAPCGVFIDGNNSICLAVYLVAENKLQAKTHFFSCSLFFTLLCRKHENVFWLKVVPPCAKHEGRNEKAPSCWSPRCPSGLLWRHRIPAFLNEIIVLQQTLNPPQPLDLSLSHDRPWAEIKLSMILGASRSHADRKLPRLERQSSSGVCLSPCSYALWRRDSPSGRETNKPLRSPPLRKTSA